VTNIVDGNSNAGPHALSGPPRPVATCDGAAALSTRAAAAVKCVARKIHANRPRTRCYLLGEGVAPDVHHRGGRSPGVQRSRMRVLPAVALAAVLAVSACGGSSEQPAAAKSANRQDQMLAYSRCMRQNGVPDFPDPVNGQLQIPLDAEGSLALNSPQMKAAREACKGLMTGVVDTERTVSSEDQRRAMEFSRCMRENGVPNMPDPGPDGRLQINPDKDGVDITSPQFRAASRACRDLRPTEFPSP
jgi:hypothetical protein